jgi:hypothetical protein
MPVQKRVFASRDPGIHDLKVAARKTWMAGTNPAMTAIL